MQQRRLRHERCYMGLTNDCCSKITGEHWLSHSILKQIPELKIRGLPRSNGQTKTLPASALTANILCKRHNEAFSPLDTAAGHAFGVLSSAMRHLTAPGINTRRDRTYLIDGFALELWAVKTLLGIHFGGLSADDGKPTQKTLRFDPEQAVSHLTGQPLEWPLGFYYPGLWRTDGAHTSLAPLIHGDDLGGIQVSLQSFTLHSFVAVPEGPDETWTPKGRHRPAFIEINGPRTTSRLIFAWSGMAVGNSGFQVTWPPGST